MLNKVLMWATRLKVMLLWEIYIQDKADLRIMINCAPENPPSMIISCKYL